MIFDKILAVIASNQVEILSTLRTGDMSDDPFLPLVAGICYPFKDMEVTSTNPKFFAHYQRLD